ncbi:MAG: hypothetical protein KHX03_08150 [Clostridium sp.]|nr:hypothetical protein [Clostridium sp.]
MNKKIINMLFSDMCCSECKSDFTEDSVFVLRKEKNLNVIQVICQHCGKSFGIALLGGCVEKDKTKLAKDELALQIQDGPDAICYDDVIDAHNFFKNLDESWEKYIPEDLKKKL